MTVLFSDGQDVDLIPAGVLAVRAESGIRVYERCRVIRMCCRT